MQGWSYRDTETDGPLWTRPLNRTEEKFFWFAECNARTDLLEHLVITVEGTAPDGIMNRASVTQAWIKVKQLHPLLAAEVTNRSGQDDLLSQVAVLQSRSQERSSYWNR